MGTERLNLIGNGQLDLDALLRLGERPEPFTPGEPHFWDDPHIAQQMLKAHLSPDTGAASRRPEEIDAEVAWLVRALGLVAGHRVLDLGCGPGLYAARLAQHGVEVTGVDISQNSLDYAAAYAREHGLPATYVCSNFLAIDYEAEFDLALQTYGEVSVFSPAVRDQLFRRVYRALRPGGRFVFDVTTPQARPKYGLKNGWYASPGGFWRPGPYLVLEQGLAYEGDIYLDQYVVIEASGSVAVYRNWFLDYTPATLVPALEQQGFVVEGVWGGLSGAAYTPDSDWLGVVATRQA